MNILCVIDNLGPGGAQRQLVELGISFREKGHRVTFLTYYNMSFFVPVLKAAGITTECIEEKNYLKRILRIRKFIRNSDFDAVVSFLEGSNFICETAGLPYRRWKLIVGERNADPNIYKSLKLRFYRLFHMFADYVVANSWSNLKIVIDVNPLLNPKKCKVIYNILDFSRWTPAEGSFLRKTERFRIVTAASHIYRKNLNGLVEALLMLDRKKRDRISIEWYGDRLTEPFYDNSFPEAIEKIRRNSIDDVISFYPATAELPEKLKNADAVALFSLIEGIPNIICEGMACAKPVICSAISDVPDILNYDKSLLFDPSKPDSIKKAIEYLIDLTDNKLEEIGSLNAKICREKFSKEINVNEYLRLIEK